MKILNFNFDYVFFFMLQEINFTALLAKKR